MGELSSVWRGDLLAGFVGGEAACRDLVVPIMSRSDCVLIEIAMAPKETRNFSLSSIGLPASASSTEEGRGAR